MTLQQCKYILETAKMGSLSEASKNLFIAQSSLSSCIKQLENELGIIIFERSNRGVILTSDGAEFVRYASQIIQQSEFIKDRYQNPENIRKLHIATQHYDFISDIFCKIIENAEAEKYHFSLKEMKTHEIISEVETASSDIGIIAIRKSDRELMERYLSKKNICFVPFLETKPYIFIRQKHSLANNESIRVDMLKKYPYVFYDQGAYNASFFTEEFSKNITSDKLVEISDRASLMNVIISSDAYTIGTGIMPSELNGGKLVAVPFDSDEKYNIGYILNSNKVQSQLMTSFIDRLNKFGNSI